MIELLLVREKDFLNNDKKQRCLNVQLIRRSPLNCLPAIYKGWLVKSSYRKAHYLVLPVNANPDSYNLPAFLVSHIKHISYINSGYKLW